MALRLSKLYATEEDKVNCPFYFKMGACRHGDRCSRAHNRPLFSQTVLLPHMYVNPMSQIMVSGGNLTAEQEREIQDKFEDFYVDVFDEVAGFGEVEDMIVCDNLGDHLIGNVYLKYASEEDAVKAVAALNGRWYDRRQIVAEFSPVTDFREARCRQFEEQGCSRGGYCNFMHLKTLPREVKEELFRDQPHAGEQSRAGRDRPPERGYDRGGDSRGSDPRGPDRGGYDRVHDRYDRRPPSPRGYDRDRRY